MPLKGSTFAVCSGSYIPAVYAPICQACIASSCANPTSPRRRQVFGRPLRFQARGFAAVLDEGKEDGLRKRAEAKALPSWPSSVNPTPYEIFDQKKGSPYSKAKFFDLVKLYHPDRHHHTKHHAIPRATKLERYRLVVAANEILSDPVKRRAYDLYGAGWVPNAGEHDLHRTADRSWRNEPGNASMNATWEDWERWYNERDGKKQEPVYMSNGGFFGIIVIFMVLGSWGQATRMANSSQLLVEMAEQRHDVISQEIQRRHSDSAFLGRRERIEHFLIQRESWGYDQAGPRVHSSQNPEDN